MAVIGADGAGKTTVVRRLQSTLPQPVRYIYMGVNPDASNVVLPTTFVLRAIRRARGAPAAGGPPDHTRRLEPKGVARRSWQAVRSMLGVGNLLAEEWSRQILAWYHVARGRIVLFDRHFYSDYYMHDVVTGGRKVSPWRRLHGLMLEHVYPRPDLVILLDAPAEVLWARKQEGSFEAVTRRRKEYLRMGDVFKGFAVVDASQTEDVVLREVEGLILDRWERRRTGS